MPEYEEKKPLWRRAIEFPWKVWVWLRNRRSARAVSRAIVNNRVATAALASSVAAAGIGGYATYQNAQTNSRLGALANRVDTLEHTLATDRADLIATQTDLSRVDKRDAAAIAALVARTDQQATRVGLLAADLAKIPPSPDIAPLTSRVAALTQDTLAAQKAAQQALGAALAARPDQPFVYHLPDLHILADVPAVSAGHIVAALPPGEYKVDISTNGSSIAYDWWLDGFGLEIHGQYAESPVVYSKSGFLQVGNSGIDETLMAHAWGGDFSDLTGLTVTLTKVVK